jgi:hypothetical protein
MRKCVSLFGFSSTSLVITMAWFDKFSFWIMSLSTTFILLILKNILEFFIYSSIQEVLKSIVLPVVFVVCITQIIFLSKLRTRRDSAPSAHHCHLILSSTAPHCISDLWSISVYHFHQHSIVDSYFYLNSSCYYCYLCYCYL